MMCVKNKLRILLLATSLVGAGFWVYEELVESFYVRSIHLKTWPKTNYEDVSCDYSLDKVRKIVDQPFTYLGKGRQFFVFASADGKYVLKFIKCQRVNVSDFYEKMPLPGFLAVQRTHRLQLKQQRTDGLFASIALAAGKLSEHTGTVFAHLSTQPQIKKQITLVDKLGFSRVIALDSVPFVLQHRAVEVLPTFEKLIALGNYKMVHERFNQLIGLILSDAKAGVVDIDSGTIVRNNVAFLADRAIHVDIGTFQMRDDAMSHANLKTQLSHLDPLIEWIATKDPGLAAELQIKIQQVLNSSRL